MKALVLEAYNKFDFRDVPNPVISDDEVLVEVKAVGICGSDVHGMDGSTGRRIPPIIMGHEASGRIITTGENVVQWKPGDRVLMIGNQSIGEILELNEKNVVVAFGQLRTSVGREKLQRITNNFLHRFSWKCAERTTTMPTGYPEKSIILMA